MAQNTAIGRSFQLFSLLCLALAVSACGDASEFPELDQVQQEQAKDPAPEGCSSWDQIPTDFIEDCALSGGDFIECSATGVPLCCEDTPDAVVCTSDPGSLGAEASLPGLGSATENAPLPSPSLPKLPKLDTPVYRAP